MSAALFRLDSSQASAMPIDDDVLTPTPEPPEIRRGHGRGTWTHPVHADLLFDHVAMAKALKDLRGDPFSFESAVASVTLDARTNGKLKSKAHYRRQWGWTEQQQRDRWDEVIGSAEKWATAYGRLRNGTRTDGERTENGKPPDSAPESQGENGRRTERERNENGHTNKQGTSNPDDGVVNARDEADLLNPQVYPPTLETVLVTTRLHGVDDELATDVFEEFKSYRWVEWGGGNRLVRDWPTAVLRSCRRIQTNRKSKPAAGSTNGKPQSASTGKPFSDYTSRREVGSQGVDVDGYYDAFPDDPAPGTGNTP